jgi:hypothetical protein
MGPADAPRVLLHLPESFLISQDTVDLAGKRWKIIAPDRRHFLRGKRRHQGLGGTNMTGTRSSGQD